MPRILIVVAALLLVLGCTVEQEIVLGDDGTGFGTATITVDPAVIAYVRALVEAFGGLSDEPLRLFDLDAIATGIDAREGLEVVSVSSDSEASLTVAYRITDIVAALGESASFITTGGARRLDLELDRDGFIGLTSLVIPLDSPLALFVPVVASDFLTKAEYRELLGYAFGSYLEGRGIDDLVASSRMRLAVGTKGAVTTVRGGVVENRSARFDIPIIDLVTLESPISLSVTWR